MANESLVINAFSRKKKGKPNATETQQILDIKKTYGIHYAMMAIRFAKSNTIQDISWMAIQLCGFRKNVPISLAKIIPDKETAESIFTRDKYNVACRLEEATIPILDLENVTKDKKGNSPFSLWKSHFCNNEKLPETEVEAISFAVKKYGYPLINTIILNMPAAPTVSDEKRLESFQALIDCAIQRDWGCYEYVLKELGEENPTVPWGVPYACPLRLHRYFSAKAGRVPDDIEIQVMFELSEEFNSDKVIYALSGIPSSDYVKSNQFFSTRTSEEIIQRIKKIVVPQEEWEKYGLREEEKGEEDEFDDSLDEESRFISYDDEPEEKTANQNYDYSDFDENAIDSDEIFAEIGTSDEDD